MRIPRIVHQTWIDRRDVYDLESIWLAYNPTFEYNFVNDAEIDDYISTFFESRVYDAYKRITCGPAKADMYRYCVLYETGGVYVDIDITPVKSLKNYIFNSDLTVVNDMYGLYNAFIACKKRHPFMLKCIHAVCDNIENNRYNKGGHEIFYLSGPRMFAKQFHEYFNIQHGENDILSEKTTTDYQILTHNHKSRSIDQQNNKLMVTQQQNPCQKIQLKTGQHYVNSPRLYQSR